MTMNEYQEKASATAVYPRGQFEWQGVIYTGLGLAGEAGEYANKVKKIMRDGVSAETRDKLVSELGDCLWYIALAAQELGYSLESVAALNCVKLFERQKENKLHGSGDNR